VPTIEAFATNGVEAREELRTLANDHDLEGATVRRTTRLLPIFQRDLFDGDKVWTEKAKRVPG